MREFKDSITGRDEKSELPAPQHGRRSAVGRPQGRGAPPPNRGGPAPAVALDQSTVDDFREGAENVVKDAIVVAKKLQPTLEM
jgi:hypothetical protein